MICFMTAMVPRSRLIYWEYFPLSCLKCQKSWTLFSWRIWSVDKLWSANWRLWHRNGHATSYTSTNQTFQPMAWGIQGHWFSEDWWFSREYKQLKKKTKVFLVQRNLFFLKFLCSLAPPPFFPQISWGHPLFQVATCLHLPLTSHLPGSAIFVPSKWSFSYWQES